MNAVMKRLPASESTFRVSFSSAVGQRPVSELVVDGADALRSLLETLDVNPRAASKVIVELEGTGNSWLESLPIESGELKIALRNFEAQQAEAK